MAGYGTLTANSTVWDDLNFPIIPRQTGSTIATGTAIDTGDLILVPQWQAGDWHICDGNEIPHGWKEGSTIYWHIHLYTNGLDNTNRYTRWTIDWVITNVNGVLTEMTPIDSGDILIPANTTSKTMFIASIGSVALTNYRIGAHIIPRLTRVAASPGTAPSNNPWVGMLQAHIEFDTLGSSQITAK